MRIAIDGVQSTGKSTLFNELQSRLHLPIKFISEASRVIAPRFGVHSSEDWDGLLNHPQELQQFFTDLEAWQEHQENSTAEFIIDSSFYLHAAYKEFFGMGRLNREPSGYDLILFCPVAELPFEADGFRFDVGRERVEQNYRRLITAYKGKFYELPLLSRCNIALGHIQELDQERSHLK